MGNHRIQFFAADGVYLGQWATEGSSFFSGPTSLAVAPDGKAVYATRGHADRVLIYGIAAAPVAWGREGQGSGEFKNPDGVAIAPDGTLYVLDSGNHRVQAFAACVTG
jgi:tripartite motif-containing protein 71